MLNTRYLHFYYIISGENVIIYAIAMDAIMSLHIEHMSSNNLHDVPFWAEHFPYMQHH